MHFASFMMVFLLLVSLITATFIYGDIYRFDTLEKVNGSVIKIDGAFSYQLVSKKSNYSLDLPIGEYRIFAVYTDITGNDFYVNESVKLGDVTQQIDLVLKPDAKDDNALYLIATTIAVLVAVIIFLKFKRRPASESKIIPELKPYELDEDGKKVIQAIGSFEGRTTQKELKDNLGFSDAKLSLILSELEQFGKIQKFKRGRGNIIRKL